METGGLLASCFFFLLLSMESLLNFKMTFGYRTGFPGEKFLYLPIVGMILFVVFYILSAILYPGGSWLDVKAEGFSFWNNYLCDLLDEYALNGKLNPGRYLSRVALGFLCGGLLLLWYYLPNLFSRDNRILKLMWVSGILALISTCFLSSGTHDFTVRLAGFFGLIAFVCCFIALYRDGQYRLSYSGWACLLIFLINYYIYETRTAYNWLPLIQKITFLSFMIWFTVLNLRMITKAKKAML